MSKLLINLDKSSETVLIASGVPHSEMSKAVNEAIWLTFGADPDVKIDLAIAEKFQADRIGVSGEEAIAWLKSIGSQHPLPAPKPRFITHD